MAIIPQKELFSWQKIEKLPEIYRIQLILENIPDKDFMNFLEKNRGKGRDDYSVRAMWNAMLIGIICGHETIESLRRELKRNPSLCEMCGFDLFRGAKAIPGAYVFTRFLKKLIKYSTEVEKIFQALVTSCMESFPDFGRHTALDGKAIGSFANKKAAKGYDGRAEHDADWGKKVYSGIGKDGNPWEKIKKWFGFKLHLLIDSKYELPISFKLTKASCNEMKIAHHLIEEIETNRPEILERCGYFQADRGLDDGKLISRLWDNWKIKAIIDIRNQWKYSEKTKLLSGTENIVYDYKGTVSCVCMATGKYHEMAFGGFEKDRNTLKYRCPAQHYGYACSGADKCRVKGSIRIPLETDRRIFTPVARSSYKWKKEYKMRTAVERVNSRLDVSFGFEHHTMRGQDKIELKLSLGFIIMLAAAVGWQKKKRPEMIRSLVKSA